jgi:hypothetical protein
MTTVTTLQRRFLLWLGYWWRLGLGVTKIVFLRLHTHHSIMSVAGSDELQRQLEEALKRNAVLEAEIGELRSQRGQGENQSGGAVVRDYPSYNSTEGCAEVTVLDLDMDLFDCCLVESDWGQLVAEAVIEDDGRRGGRTPPLSLQESLRLKREKVRSAERTKERVRVVAHESWRYRPCTDVDITIPEDSDVARQQNRASMGNISEIHDFCFPDGVYAQYMSKSAAEILVQEENDQFHLMQFANASGQQSYACVLTVTKIVDIPNLSALDVLAKVASMRKPARIIRDFMRKLIVYIKKERWLNVELPGMNKEHEGGGFRSSLMMTGSANSVVVTEGNDNSPVKSTGTSSADTPQSRAGRMYQYLQEAASSSSSVAGPVINSSTSTESIASSLFGTSSAPPPRAPSTGDPDDAPRESIFSFGGSGSSMTRNYFTSPSTFTSTSATKGDKMDGEKKGDGEKKKEEGEEKKKEDEGGEKRKDEKGGKKEQADSSDVSKPGMSSDRESITKRDSELAGVKSTPVADQGSFFGRMRARWQEARTTSTETPDKRGSLGDRDRSSSVVRISGATTTNPSNELSLLPHSYNALTSDIDMLPEAPPDPSDIDIEAYEQRRKSESSSGKLRKMSLSSRSKSGSAHYASSGDDFGRKKTSSRDADEPMLIPGIGSALGSGDGFSSGSGFPSPGSPTTVGGGTSLSLVQENSEVQKMLEPDIERELEALDPATSAERAKELLNVEDGKDNKKDGDDAEKCSAKDDGEKKALSSSGSDTAAPSEEATAAKVVVTPEKLEDPGRHKGRVAVAEVAYCLVSSFPVQTIGYHVLKSLADAERNVFTDEEKSRADGKGENEDGKKKEDAATVVEGSLPVVERVQKARNDYFRSVHLSLTRWQRAGGLQAHMGKSGHFFTNNAYNKTIEGSGSSYAAVSANRVQQAIDWHLVSLNEGSSSSSKKRRSSEHRNSTSGRRSSVGSGDYSTIADAANPNILHPIGLNLDSMSPVEEWALTVTLSFLNSGTILKLVNLLLMEKSLVVVGKYSAIVSIVTIGVKNLILPFKWEGVFVALVPGSARELFGAPVPYILGTTHAPREDEVSSNSAVLFLSEDEQSAFLSYTNCDAAAAAAAVAVAPGLEEREAGVLTHVASLSSQVHYPVADTVAWFTRLPDTINADMPHDETVAKTIDSTRRYLKACRQRTLGAMMQLRDKSNGKERSDVRAARLDMHYLVSLTMRERSALAGIARVIHCHNMQFCGDSVNPTAWRRYVKFNTATGEEEFYPNWFMQPVRRHVEFQEAVVQTQLFVGFMDSVRVAAERQDKFRGFIYDWVYFRLHLAKKKLGKT